MDASFVPYRLAAAYLLNRLLEQQQHHHDKSIPLPVVGIICGSGLSELSHSMLDRPHLVIPYSDVPGFPQHQQQSCTVPGHVGQIVMGTMLGGTGNPPPPPPPRSHPNHNNEEESQTPILVPTMCFRGRFHAYEGHAMHTIVLPVRVMRCLGSVRVCIVTNAAGALNAHYRVGDIVSISDHVALPLLASSNMSPLCGPNDPALGPRFPASSNAYPHGLRHVVQNAAEAIRSSMSMSTKSRLRHNKDPIHENNDATTTTTTTTTMTTTPTTMMIMEEDIPTVHAHGTYCYVCGPQYESRAEGRFLRNALKGDCVGMSSVPEIIAAHHCQLLTVCLSLITNRVLLHPHHEEEEEEDEKFEHNEHNDENDHHKISSSSSSSSSSMIATHTEVLEAAQKRSKYMQALVQQIVATIHEDILPTLPPLPSISLDVSDVASNHHNKPQQNVGRMTLLAGSVILGCAIGATTATMMMMMIFQRNNNNNSTMTMMGKR